MRSNSVLKKRGFSAADARVLAISKPVRSISRCPHGRAVMDSARVAAATTPASASTGGITLHRLSPDALSASVSWSAAMRPSPPTTPSRKAIGSVASRKDGTIAPSRRSTKGGRDAAREDHLDEAQGPQQEEDRGKNGDPREEGTADLANEIPRRVLPMKRGV